MNLKSIIKEELQEERKENFKEEIKNEDTHGQLIILTGFSGAGKSSIADGLLEKSDRYIRSISATTRSPRPTERDGRDYYFLSKKEFELLEAEHAFLESAEYCDEKYGTLIAPIVQQLQQGRDVILVLEYSGAIHVQELFPQAISFFIAASAAELEKRLKDRKMPPKETQKRLSQSARDVMYIPKFDYLIRNNHGMLEKSINLIDGIIKGYKASTSNNLKLIENITEEFASRKDI